MDRVTNKYPPFACEACFNKVVKRVGTPSIPTLRQITRVEVEMTDYRGKILVVEDSDQIRELLTLVLSAEDYDVKDAEDGEEGLRLAREWTPDLITMDLALPKKDGWSVIKELKKDKVTKGISILVISAYTRELDKPLRRRVDRVISKPFYITQVVNEVTEIFEKRRKS